jgi:small ubiquitin-related modifier
MSEEKQENKEEETKSEHINVKVVNAEGNEVFFKIKKSTPLKKLMEAYCKRQGLSQGSVRFSFDGNRIDGEQTAEEVIKY